MHTYCTKCMHMHRCGVCPYLKWLFLCLTELCVQRSRGDRGLQGKPTQAGLPMGLLLTPYSSTSVEQVGHMDKSEI